MRVCSLENIQITKQKVFPISRRSGGYILNGSQEFIEDIPLDNILAIYDENLRGVAR